mmetsp:Transcript_22624/g.54646  ORF Transcript_22624/g.54646 Transcript_22624/m.54646 type:complete len:86 (+) Transcript_22624:62-319(+)
MWSKFQKIITELDIFLVKNRKGPLYEILSEALLIDSSYFFDGVTVRGRFEGRSSIAFGSLIALAMAPESIPGCCRSKKKVLDKPQ